MPFIVRVPRNPLPTQITWAAQSVDLAVVPNRPNFTSYLSLRYDEVNARSAMMAKDRNSMGIYSTNYFDYAAAINNWFNRGGTGNTDGSCDDGSGSAQQPWPPDRHPVLQNDIDDQGRYFQYNGVCNNIRKNDLWYRDLATGIWTEIDISASIPEVRESGAMIFSPHDQVHAVMGPPHMGGEWDYYVIGLTAGSLSAAQLAAGCVTPNQFAQVSLTGRPTAVTHPTTLGYPYFPESIYDPQLRKIVVFAGGTSTYRGGILAVYLIDIPAKTMTALTITGLDTSTEQGQNPEQKLALITSGQWANQSLYLYHKTAHSDDGDLFSEDYVVDFWTPGIARFTKLTTTGNGVQTFQPGMCWDKSVHKAITWGYESALVPQVFQGSLAA